jgi:hypothetical protein
LKGFIKEVQIDKSMMHWNKNWFLKTTTERNW